VDVIDHLIISEKSYMSFADAGLIEKMKASDTWRVVEKEEMEMKEMKAAVEKEKVEKQKAFEIARKFKALGLDDVIIKKGTGLSLAEIKKL
jgi:DNA repair protein RadC